MNKLGLFWVFILPVISAAIMPRQSFTENQTPEPAIKALSDTLSAMNALKNYNVEITVEDKEKNETSPNIFTANGIIINPDFSCFKIKETGQEYYRKGDKVAALHPSKDQWELVSESEKKQLLIAENINSSLEKLRTNLLDSSVKEEKDFKTVTLKPAGTVLQELIPQTDVNWENTSALVTVTISNKNLITQITVQYYYELKKYAVSNEWDIFENPDKPEEEKTVPQQRESKISLSIRNYNQENISISIPEEAKKLLEME